MKAPLGNQRSFHGTSAEEIWRILAKRWSETVAIEGQMAVKGKIKGRRIRARPIFLVAYPDRFYMEVGRSGTGPLAVISAAEGRIVMVFPRNREYIEEEASPQVLKQLMGIPMRAEELVALFTGSGIPIGSYELETGRSSDDKGRNLALTAMSESMNRSASIGFTYVDPVPVRPLQDPQTGESLGMPGKPMTLAACLRVAEGRVAGTGLGRQTLNFSYHDFAPDNSQPKRINVKVKGLLNLHFALVQVSFREGSPISASLFEIPVPRGAKKLNLNDLDGEGPVLLQAFR